MLPNWRSFALGLVVLVALFAVAAKEYVPPPAQHAKTYPAHDAHSTEGVAIAADPYDGRGREDVFTVPFARAGFLPIYVIVSNDNDEPITLGNLDVELLTANKTKIEPADADDIQRRFRRSGPQSAEPPRMPLPIPRAPKPPKGRNFEAVAEFNQARFIARAVEPHANRAGFFFFDVEGLSNPLTDAHLYVSGVRDGTGKELMFFDIPLGSTLPKPAGR